MLMKGFRIVVLGLLSGASLSSQVPGQEVALVNPAGDHRLPFQERDGLIYIQARVNGYLSTLVVDTGAVNTMFMVKAVHTLDADSPITVNLAKGSMMASRLPVKLALGEAERPERHCAFRLQAIVGDFKFMNAEGVIGLDVLSQFKSVAFDFKNSVMIMEDR